MVKQSAPLSPEQRDEAVRLYAALMEEVKLRIAAIETGLNSARAIIQPPFTSEFCVLQIRMICELIAMGCLVAHGDITANGKAKHLRNAWSVELIMTELGKLHPHFFPFPIQTILLSNEPGQPKNVHLEERPDQLTKEQFLTLYGRTGNVLHRGTLNKLTGRKAMNPITDEQIIKWTQQLLGLLNDHRIASWDNLRHFVCIMHDPSQGGRVNVAFAVAPENTSIEQAQSLLPEDK